jgi:putative inorganic carbon (HCO3(-)) transporter
MTANRFPDVKIILKLIVGCLFAMVFSSTFSIALSQITYFSGIVLWLFLIIQKKDTLEKTPLDSYFIIYLYLEAFTTIFAFNSFDALMHIQKRLLLIPIVYFIVRFADSRERIFKLMITLFVSATLVGIFSSISIIAQFADYAHYIKRFGLYNHYMTIGGLSMFMILLMTPFALHVKTPIRVRLLSIIGIGFILFTLLFTFTRSSWLAVIAGVFVIALLRYRKIVFVIVAILAGVAFLGSPELHARFLSIFDPNDPTNTERLRMWSLGFQIFKDHPVMGIGDVNLMAISRLYSHSSFGFGHAHNNIVMWLVTLGVSGFTFILLWFIKIWKIIWNTFKQSKDDWLYSSFSLGAIAAFVGFHVNGMFEWNFGDAEIFMMFWIIVGTVVSIMKMNERERELESAR